MSHLICLAGLQNDHRSLMRQSQAYSDVHREEKKIQARAFVELVIYVENSVEDGTFYFKFSQLRQFYERRHQNLGIEKEINKVRFKTQVLEYFPRAQEQCDGENAILLFQQRMQEMLKQASNVIMREIL